nr:MAG TPA: hypothetical protein [Bacteriophage sp.]
MYLISIVIRARKCRFLHTKSRPKPDFDPLACFAICCYLIIKVRSFTPEFIWGGSVVNSRLAILDAGVNRNLMLHL